MPNANAIMQTVSPNANRSRPWEPWVEPPQQPSNARYFGVMVEIVERFSLCALVRRPDGLSCVVDVVDLEVRQ